MLKRAQQASSLVCVARALYTAMVGDLKRLDGTEVSSPDAMLAETIASHRDPALALDLGELEQDVPLLGDLKPLLESVQDWISRGAPAYSGLQPKFFAREYNLKDDRALLLPASVARRAAWTPTKPWPLTYRWDKVARFLDELAPAA